MILDKKMQIFLAVAEASSFSQASKKFSLSQSVISFHIDTLENELGVRLFDRHGRMITLTPEGEYLYNEGKKLALSARQLEESFSEHSSIIARYVRVAGCTLTCAFTLPWIIANFHQQYPDVLFAFKTLHQEEMIDQLLNEEIDFGFAGYPIQHRKLTSTNCFRDEIILVGKPGIYPSQLKLDELSEYPLLWINSDRGLDLLIRKSLPEAGLLIKNLKIYLEVEDLSVLKTFVRTGIGLAFLPRVSVADELESGALEQIKVDNLELVRHTCMLHLKKKDHREVAERFLQFIENHPSGNPPIPKSTD